MKKTIKVLFVFPSSQVWGGEKVWLKFLAKVDRDKFSPFVLTFGEGKLLKRLEKIDMPYYLLPTARIRNVFSSLKNLLCMESFLKEEKFDIVNSLGVHLLTTLATSILSIPYVLHIHTVHPLSLIDRWCLRRTRHIVTVSNFSKEFLIGYGVKSEYIEVIYNGIDIEDLEKKVKDSDLRKELGLDKDTQIVCYIGRIVKWKSLEMLIRVVPKIKQGYSGKVKFLFVGDTPKGDFKSADYKNTLLKLAEELEVEDDIIFTGRREDIANILKNISIFAIPSQLETFPMSVLEAMAMAKPVVAIRVGGIPELTTKDTGILVEPGDLDDFADAIVGLLEDKEKRLKMGIAGRRRVKEQFTLESHIFQVQNYMKKCYAYRY